MVLGGRIGYCLFYKLAITWRTVGDSVCVEGRMSFHGGMLGVLVSQICLRARAKAGAGDGLYRAVRADRAGGGASRQFQHGDSGREASPDLPWGMVSSKAVPCAAPPVAGLPVLMEGLLLFILLWLYARQTAQDGAGFRAF